MLLIYRREKRCKSRETQICNRVGFWAADSLLVCGLGDVVDVGRGRLDGGVDGGHDGGGGWLVRLGGWCHEKRTNERT